MRLHGFQCDNCKIRSQDKPRALDPGSVHERESRGGMVLGIHQRRPALLQQFMPGRAHEYLEVNLSYRSSIFEGSKHAASPLPVLPRQRLPSLWLVRHHMAQPEEGHMIEIKLKT